MEGTPEVVDTVIIAQKNAAGSTMSPDSVNYYTLILPARIIAGNEYKKTHTMKCAGINIQMLIFCLLCRMEYPIPCRRQQNTKISLCLKPFLLFLGHFARTIVRLAPKTGQLDLV